MKGTEGEGDGGGPDDRMPSSDEVGDRPFPEADLLRSSLLRVVAALFVGLRLALSLGFQPVATFDTADYTYMSQQPVQEILLGGMGEPLTAPVLERVDGPDFPLTEKSPLTSIVHKILLRHADGIVWLQTIVGAVSWVVLAVVVAGRMGKAAFFGILLIGLSPLVAMWDRFLLSDSLSFSGLALLLATLFRLFDRLSMSRILQFAAAAAAFGLARDLNAYLVLGIGTIIALAGITRKFPREWWAVGLSCMVVFAASAFSARAGERELVPLLHAISMNVLIDEGRTEDMVEAGMPVGPRLLEYADENVISGYGRDPELAGFHEWVRERGQRAYIEMALRNPGWTLTKPLAERSALYLGGQESYSSTHLRLDNVLTRWVVAGHDTALVLHLVVGFIGVGTLVRRRDAAGVIICAGLLATAACWGLANYHGDGNEYARHGKEALVLVALAVVLSVALSTSTGAGLARRTVGS